MGISLGAALVQPSASQASVWLGRREEASWPREGSTVEYELRSSFTVPDESYHLESVARLILTYDGTAWGGSCSGTATEVVEGIAATTEWESSSQGQPALAPVDVRAGDTVDLSLLADTGIAEECRQRGQTVEVATIQDGVIQAQETPDSSAYQDVSANWDQATGLVLEWDGAYRTGSSAGRLVASDAVEG